MMGLSAKMKHAEIRWNPDGFRKIYLCAHNFCQFWKLPRLTPGY